MSRDTVIYNRTLRLQQKLERRAELLLRAYFTELFDEVANLLKEPEIKGKDDPSSNSSRRKINTLFLYLQKGKDEEKEQVADALASLLLIVAQGKKKLWSTMKRIWQSSFSATAALMEAYIPQSPSSVSNPSIPNTPSGASEPIVPAPGAPASGSHSPDYNDYLRTHGADKVRNIDDGTRKVLREVLIEQATNPDATRKSMIEGIHNAVQGRSNARSKVIALTEVHTSTQQAVFDNMKARHIKKKKWLTALDERVRPQNGKKQKNGADHRRLHGEIQPINRPFSNGLMFPGDPNGPPEEVIRCRCIIVPFF